MRPPTVFIIASNADYAPAWRVHQHLSAEGVECFFCDEALLRVGEKGYQSKAERALENAEGLVVVAGSRERVEAEWVRSMWRKYLDRPNTGPAGGAGAGTGTGTARRVTTMRCGGMSEEELPRTLRRSGSLAFPEELGELHDRLLRPGENHAAARPAAASAAGATVVAAASAPLTRRFVMMLTALNAVILGAVIWLLVQYGSRLLPDGGADSSLADGGRGTGKGKGKGTDRTRGSGDGGSGGSGGGGLTNSGDNGGDAEDAASARFARNGSDNTGAAAAHADGAGAGADAASGAPDSAEQGATGDGGAPERAQSVTDTPVAGTPFYLNWRDFRLAFVFIPRGKFQMGSPENEYRRDLDEPLHNVEITRGFWLARTECPQSLWYAVMGTEPSKFTGHPELPVESVAWEDLSGPANSFLARMNRDRMLPKGWKFALPSEAQWEYACRAGTRTAFNFGKTFSSNLANCDAREPYRGGGEGTYLAHPVKVSSYAPNAWGLFDMHGNVAECCADMYLESPGAERDPLETKGSGRVRRGGSWADQPANWRSAARVAVSESGAMDNTTGFRMAIVAVE